MDEALTRRAGAVEWLKSMVPELDLQVEASEEELGAALKNGDVLCAALSRVNAGFAEEVGSGGDLGSSGDLQSSKKLGRFLLAVEEMGLCGFSATELQEGSLSGVVECILSLRDRYCLDAQEGSRYTNGFCRKGALGRKKWYIEAEKLERLDGSNGDCILNGHKPLSVLERTVTEPESDFQRVLQGSDSSELSTSSFNHAGEKFHEVFQLRKGPFSDISPARITELMKSHALESTSVPSLLSIAYGILDDCDEKKNGEIPQRVACLLKKLLQEIEQRFSHQSELIRQLNHMVKAREEKYNLRMRVLEMLATGTNEENQLTREQLQLIKTEKMEIEEKRKTDEQDLVMMIEEKNIFENIIADLKKEMQEMLTLHERKCLELESKHDEAKFELEKRIKEVRSCLTDSHKRTEELKALTQSKAQGWNRKEFIYQNFIDSQSQSIQDLRAVSNSVKKDMLNIHKIWDGEFTLLGSKLKGLTDAAENYHMVLAENRRLYNEVQELKGNIRVYCRIRPFLPGQNRKMTCIDYAGENGELVILNPTKQGRDAQRMFKFNKIFGLHASQEEVFLDTQPLIRSVLDGYNVCIFAYGQTGSGKTYTMSGPDASSKEVWGVNYRALNDLFYISRTRRNTFIYEVGVQMVEIYNEQIRDLLSNGSTQKRLGIWSSSQPNGLAVPDASLHPVRSTSDVLDLMQIGQTNRAVGATALNERSSRSHSVLTVHVRGTDLESGTSLRGCLHLVDLAGSERVDRSEATGDRLKEAQHINKSLSALGDVIFALAQKSPHVPYRNSKLTQLLQSSLGGQAKTLMFVQINPDVESYSETVSTLKFAERVSGVELGAAKSNKEGRDVRDLLQQVASLKEVIARKNEDIEQLQMQRNMRRQYANLSSRNLAANTHTPSLSGNSQRRQKLMCGRSGFVNKAASDPEICSDYSDKQSEVGSLQSMDDFKQQREVFCHGRTNEGNYGDVDLLGLDGGDLDERLSDISDGDLSMGTETDGSMTSVVEYTLFPEVGKLKDNERSVNASKKSDDKPAGDCNQAVENLLDNPNEKKAAVPPHLPPSPLQKARRSTLTHSRTKEILQSSSLPRPRRPSTSQFASSSARPSRRRP